MLGIQLEISPKYGFMCNEISESLKKSRSGNSRRICIQSHQNIDFGIQMIHGYKLSANFERTVSEIWQKKKINNFVTSCSF